MAKIKFLKDYDVKATDGLNYKKGETHEMEMSSANHFIKRGIAELIEKKKIKKEKDDSELKHLGAGWFEMPNGSKIHGKKEAKKAFKEMTKPEGSKEINKDSEIKELGGSYKDLKLPGSDERKILQRIDEKLE